MNPQPSRPQQHWWASSETQNQPCIFERQSWFHSRKIEVFRKRQAQNQYPFLTGQVYLSEQYGVTKGLDQIQIKFFFL
jgi:hypothetical protein